MPTLKGQIHNLAEWLTELEDRLAAAEQQIVDLMSELEATRDPIETGVETRPDGTTVHYQRLRAAGTPAKSAEK